MIPVANVSLLYALAGTQLTRRLEREGRLHKGYAADRAGNAGDFVVAGLNFETARPRRAIMSDYVNVVSSLYRPEAFFRRARGVALALRRIDLGTAILLRDGWREIDRFFNVMWHVTWRRPEMRWRSWWLLLECLIRNPRAVRMAVAMIVFYLYLGPLTRYVTGQVEARLGETDEAPPRLSQPAVAAA